METYEERDTLVENLEIFLSTAPCGERYADDKSDITPVEERYLPFANLRNGDYTSSIETGKLARRWPYVKTQLDQNDRFARGKETLDLPLPRGATTEDVKSMLYFILAQDKQLHLRNLGGCSKIFRSCITAHLVGVAYHRELAQAAVRDLGRHCDDILDNICNTDYFETDRGHEGPSEDHLIDMFECDELAPVLRDLYHPDVTVDTIAVRQVLVPFLWIFERGAYYKEFHDLAETNDKFAGDMGRYILFMKKQGTPWEPNDRSHQVRSHYEKVTRDSPSESLGCAGCGGPNLRRERMIWSVTDEETESETDGEMDGKGATEQRSEDDSGTDGEMEVEQGSTGTDYYRPVMFDPFATVLTWRHVKYWCGNCYHERESDEPIWRSG